MARHHYLGNTEYRIHGTNQPSTIGSFVSSGCVRLTNADVEDLYRRVTVAPASLFCRERIRRSRKCVRGISQEHCDRLRKSTHHAVYAAVTPKDKTAVNFSEVIFPDLPL
jgi:hypothetical protein